MCFWLLFCMPPSLVFRAVVWCLCLLFVQTCLSFSCFWFSCTTCLSVLFLCASVSCFNTSESYCSVLWPLILLYCCPSFTCLSVIAMCLCFSFLRASVSHFRMRFVPQCLEFLFFCDIFLCASVSSMCFCYLLLWGSISCLVPVIVVSVSLCLLLSELFLGVPVPLSFVSPTSASCFRVSYSLASTGLSLLFFCFSVPLSLISPYFCLSFLCASTSFF